MENFEKSIFIICLLMCQILLTTGNNCDIVEGQFGTIQRQLHYAYSGYGSYKKCWKIRTPLNKFLLLTLTKAFPGECSNLYLRISVDETGEEFKLCQSNLNRIPVTVFNSVTVTLNDSNSYYGLLVSFELEYKIQDIACVYNSSFHCSEYSCIPRSQVCDGVKQCENGNDEVGCETGIHAVDGVATSRKNAVNWLLSQRTSSWGWGEDTPRAVVALFLAAAANFNGTNLEEELMAKQTELKASVALLKSENTNNELSMFVNALLVTCHDPRHFYGNDLVKLLKTQVEETDGFIHPVAYLSLCNANETWPAKAISDLRSVMNSSSHYPFIVEIQAMAVMALSCFTNRTRKLNLTDLTLYNDTIERFKSLQLEDGSFGTVYTTSLITQALIASGNEQSKDWKVNSTIKFLMKELNSTSVDFLSTSLTLPILNRKSIVDISKVNCSANARKHGDDIISEINDYLGTKMRVRYSLYIGDEKDVIHTISLRVPENFTAFDVMKTAELEDSKYSFKWKKMTGKTYVYEIANKTNDLEVGKFWLQYLASTNDTKTFTHPTQSPDELVLNDEDHLIMWYKTAHI